jgi:hypothetical protein
MAGIEKEYFSLEEIESQWGIPHRDLEYLAENGLLKVSVRLYGIHVENGSIEETEDGECFSIPEERIWFEGLQDLRKHDVYLSEDDKSDRRAYTAKRFNQGDLAELTQLKVTRQH